MRVSGVFRKPRLLIEEFKKDVISKDYCETRSKLSPTAPWLSLRNLEIGMQAVDESIYFVLIRKPT
tara:strand:+ start:31702 stop:31899 length:198 start_codon:yes stop_codon:yes gene_type:complete